MRIKNTLFYSFLLLIGIGFASCEEGSDEQTPTQNPTLGEYTQKHVKNVLIEDFTGTWCGYCPRVAAAIDEAIATSDNVIAMAIHDDDDMPYAHVTEMMTKYSITGYPTGLIDRNYKWPYPENFAGLNNALILKAPLGLKIETSLNNRTATITVSVEFVVDFPYNTNIVVCLTEDGVIADQANYYNDGRGNPIVNFEHKHVLRAAATNIFGNQIPMEQTKKDNIATFTYTMNISNAYNIDKCNIVAFVTKSTGKIVFNTQTVKLGESKDFQYLAK